VTERQDVVTLLDRSTVCHVGLVTDGQPLCETFSPPPD